MILEWYADMTKRIIDAGKVFSIKELCDKYAPEFWDQIPEEVKAYHSKQDGNLYYLPSFMSSKEEYEKSILEVDRQLASMKELSHNSEVLELRLSSAVNLMKQLQLDLARVKGASLSNTASFDMLKEKSDELSRYIQDLESGYDELESGR